MDNCETFRETIHNLSTTVDKLWITLVWGEGLGRSAKFVDTLTDTKKSKNDL